MAGRGAYLAGKRAGATGTGMGTGTGTGRVGTGIACAEGDDGMCDEWYGVLGVVAEVATVVVLVATRAERGVEGAGMQGCEREGAERLRWRAFVRGGSKMETGRCVCGGTKWGVGGGPLE